MNLLVGVVGPTGVGKSRIALKIGQDFDAEIVSCDSRQIYRHMDIGTAKPSPEELSSIKHHLIDVADPDEEVSLATYQEMAYDAINNINSRGKLPVLTGGTGQYFWAVIEGWQVPKVPPDMGLRQSLEKEAAEKGADGMYEELLAADPVAAGRIDPRNVRRTIRALEVFRSRGSRFPGKRADRRGQKTN
jgi:tRNA dimethylallyltransferase